MTSKQASRGMLVLVCLVSAGGARLRAQTDQPAGTRSEFETRAELEAQAKAAESQHRTSEAWLLRTRLEKGDFQEGDRIVVRLHSVAAIKPVDTLIVRAGKVLQLPQMADLPLEGVLRSELNDRFVRHMARYLTDPEARTTPLVRIGVFGRVGSPGYYYLSADVVLNDVVMRAGGPAGDADMNKVEVRRGDEVIWNDTETRTALNEGLSIDRLHLRAGDVIQVGARRQIQWLSVLSVSIGLLGVAIALFKR